MIFKNNFCNPFMLKLNFPFTIENENTSIDFVTHVERRENLITFSLEYKFNISIEKAKCLSIQKHNEGFIYAFEFADINDAIIFEKHKKCEVGVSSLFSDPKEIEKEIVDYANIYCNSNGTKKKQRKKLVEDENGFQRYI